MFKDIEHVRTRERSVEAVRTVREETVYTVKVGEKFRVDFRMTRYSEGVLEVSLRNEEYIKDM